MALVVEDGTGLAEADSYQTVAEYKSYCDKMGYTYPADNLIEVALRRGALWVDAVWGDRYPGSRLRGREQALGWPRINVKDAEGQAVDAASVPREIKLAQAEAAKREAGSPGSLFPDVVEGKVKRSVSVSGAVSVTYASGANVVDSMRPTLTIVGDILAPLLAVQRSNVGYKFLGRA